MKKVTINFDSGLSPQEMANQITNIPTGSQIEIVPQLTANIRFLESSADDFTMEAQIRSFEKRIEEFKKNLIEEMMQLKGLLLDKGFSVC